MCPRRVRERSVFFLLIPICISCPPAVSFLPNPFSSFCLFFSLPERVGWWASHSTSLFPLSTDPYNGGFLKDRESVLLMTYIYSTINIASSADTTGAAVS